MNLAQAGLSALSKLLIVGVLAAAFVFGMAGVVYMSLQGDEVRVPEVVGKDFGTVREELASMGLKIKNRADRFSTEAPNTILEQLPKPGETVKTGQMILVVVAKAGGGPDETPVTIKKDTEANDAEKIEEMISDEPVKKTTTRKKKADTKRDVIANTSAADNTDADAKSDTDAKAADKPDKPAVPATKPATPPDTDKPAAAKPPGTDPQR